MGFNQKIVFPEEIRQAAAANSFDYDYLSTGIRFEVWEEGGALPDNFVGGLRSPWQLDVTPEVGGRDVYTLMRWIKGADKAGNVYAPAINYSTLPIYVSLRFNQAATGNAMVVLLQLNPVRDNHYNPADSSADWRFSYQSKLKSGEEINNRDGAITVSATPASKDDWDSGRFPPAFTGAAEVLPALIAFCEFVEDVGIQEVDILDSGGNTQTEITERVRLRTRYNPPSTIPRRSVFNFGELTYDLTRYDVAPDRRYITIEGTRGVRRFQAGG